MHVVWNPLAFIPPKTKAFVSVAITTVRNIKIRISHWDKNVCFLSIGCLDRHSRRDPGCDMGGTTLIIYLRFNTSAFHFPFHWFAFAFIRLKFCAFFRSVSVFEFVFCGVVGVQSIYFVHFIRSLVFTGFAFLGALVSCGATFSSQWYALCMVLWFCGFIHTIFAFIGFAKVHLTQFSCLTFVSHARALGCLVCLHVYKRYVFSIFEMLYLNDWNAYLCWNAFCVCFNIYVTRLGTEFGDVQSSTICI